MLRKINNLNEKFAEWFTLRFGTMWTFYAFMLYGLLPLIKAISPYMDKLLYWSNWVQLWSLPLLMVGTNILGRKSEVRSQETHDAVMSELAELKSLLAKEDKIEQEIKQIEQEVHDGNSQGT